MGAISTVLVICMKKPPVKRPRLCNVTETRELSHWKQKIVNSTTLSSLAAPAVFKRKPDDTLHWLHNDHDGVSSHQPHGCLLNRSFRRRSKKTSKLRVIGLCVGNSPGPVNSPHKGPVIRGKCFLLMTSSWKVYIMATLGCRCSIFALMCTQPDQTAD